LDIALADQETPVVADISQRIVNDQIEPVEYWDERGLEIKKDIWGRQSVPLETVPVPDLADGQGPIGVVPGSFPFRSHDLYPWAGPGFAVIESPMSPWQRPSLMLAAERIKVKGSREDAKCLRFPELSDTQCMNLVNTH
jgi:hypothetical protein